MPDSRGTTSRVDDPGRRAGRREYPQQTGADHHPVSDGAEQRAALPGAAARVQRERRRRLHPQRAAGRPDLRSPRRDAQRHSARRVNGKTVTWTDHRRRQRRRGRARDQRSTAAPSRPSPLGRRGRLQPDHHRVHGDFDREHHGQRDAARQHPRRPWQPTARRVGAPSGAAAAPRSRSSRARATTTTATSGPPCNCRQRRPAVAPCEATCGFAISSPTRLHDELRSARSSELDCELRSSRRVYANDPTQPDDRHKRGLPSTVTVTRRRQRRPNYDVGVPPDITVQPCPPSHSRQEHT